MLVSNDRLSLIALILSPWVLHGAYLCAEGLGGSRVSVTLPPETIGLLKCLK